MKMKHLPIVFIMALSILLSGCIPPDAKGVIYPQISETSRQRTPKGEVLSAQVGENIYEEGETVTQRHITAVTQAKASGHMYGLHYIDVPAGFIGDLMTRSVDGAQIMCVDIDQVSHGIFQQDESYKCLADANKYKIFESSTYSNHTPYWPLKSSVPYITKVTQQNLDEQHGFKYQLLYQGYAQGVLRFSYREYTNDMARPAFTQELTYEHKPGEKTIVGLKGLRAKVIDANNTSIRYVIENDINTTNRKAN